MIDDENQSTSWKMGDTSSDYLNLSLVSFLKLTTFQGCNCRVSLFNLFLWVEIRRYFWKVTKHCWAEEKVQEAELRDNLWLTQVAFCTEVCLFSSSPYPQMHCTRTGIDTKVTRTDLDRPSTSYLCEPWSNVVIENYFLAKQLRNLPHLIQTSNLTL